MHTQANAHNVPKLISYINNMTYEQTTKFLDLFDNKCGFFTQIYSPPKSTDSFKGIGPQARGSI